MDEEEVNIINDLNKNIIEEVTSKISGDAVMEKVVDLDTIMEEVTGGQRLSGGQRLTKSRAVQHKYIYCNKEGVLKGINVDTLDLEYSDKQKRNTTTHVTGCKARIRLVRNTVNGRYKLEQFQPKHNHMLIPKEYKHFTKKQRKMNQSEKMFVVKAATNKIGATRAHNLLCSMKGGYEYVHGTTDDFKNHQRDVNVFIENSELVAMFWADEVAKCNYKEFGDIVSFDATFNSNKYNMKFVSFVGIDNHGKCVTLGSGMLLHEDTKSYMWLLNAFMTAFSHEPIMIVTDKDGAMKRAIESVFKKAKHRLCMWHIMQKIPSKTGSHEIHSESHEIQSESHEIRQDCMFLCRHIFCVFKNRDINVITKQYILRRWTRDIIPPDLSRQRNKYEGKNLTIERLTNEANFLVDDSLFLLSKDEGNMGAYVEPNQIAMQNPTKAVNKGEHLKKGERLKSDREKSLKVGKKKLRVCGFCKEKTNKHTNTTCYAKSNKGCEQRRTFEEMRTFKE
nr:hypothetical protein [Tanacetum cinerariifolium]